HWTRSGQCGLIDRVERLEAVGVEVHSCNTDGLFGSASRRDRRWEDVLRAWQAETELPLEVVPLRRLVILATNRYAYVDCRGGVKRKGDTLKDDRDPFATPSFLVVGDAIVHAFLGDIPPERTILTCQDPARFCGLTVPTEAMSDPVVYDEATGQEYRMPKPCRWDRAKESESSLRLRYTNAAGNKATPPNAEHIRVWSSLPAVPWRGLDYAWYFGMARAEVHKVRSYPHLARKLVGDHAGAHRLLDLGLTPCPKHAKKLPAGATAKCPTFLWDWDS